MIAYTLLNIKQEALEVLPFRMVYVHRVVAWLVETIQDADAAAALRCSGEDCEGEGLFVDYLRAAVCEHETAWGNLGDSSGIEALIRSEGVLE